MLGLEILQTNSFILKSLQYAPVYCVRYSTRNVYFCMSNTEQYTENMTRNNSVINRLKEIIQFLSKPFVFRLRIINFYLALLFIRGDITSVADIYRLR